LKPTAYAARADLRCEEALVPPKSDLVRVLFIVLRTRLPSLFPSLSLAGLSKGFVQRELWVGPKVSPAPRLAYALSRRRLRSGTRDFDGAKSGEEKMHTEKIMRHRVPSLALLCIYEDIAKLTCRGRRSKNVCAFLRQCPSGHQRRSWCKPP